MCLYLRCDAGSNFVGPRNTEEQVIDEMIGHVDNEWAEEWMMQGKGQFGKSTLLKLLTSEVFGKKQLEVSER